MKESEYINATDLVKLRAAYDILGDVHSSTGTHAQRLAVFRTLSAWIDKAYEKLDVEEDE